MSSNSSFGGALEIPVTTLEYRDITDSSWLDPRAAREGAYDSAAGKGGDGQITEAELAARLRQEREQTARETEQRMRREYEEKLAQANSAITAALKTFSDQRSEYFMRVEAEVVQLSLSIAAKILHREAQVDPMLVAALVRIAIEKLREGSHVTVHVSSARVTSWKTYFKGFANLTDVDVVADEGANEFDCLVETELGTAHFGLDKQLKEIEQGFFDLLALRPIIS